MLRIKLNKNDAVPSYRFLFDNNSDVTGICENGVITFSLPEGVGNIEEGDRLLFTKNGCNGERLFTQEVKIENFSKKSISLKAFDDIILDTVPINVEYSPLPSFGGLRFLEFNTRGYHCFADDACVEIKEHISGDYSEYDENKKRCPYDYVVYNEYFLYQPETVTNGKYVLPETEWYDNLKNQKGITVKAKNKNIYDRIGSQSANDGEYWSKENGVIFLKKCFIPVLHDGHNNMNKIIWYGTTSTFDGFLADDSGISEYDSTEFSCADERFYENNESGVTFKPNVEVFLIHDTIKVHGAIEENFGTNLFQKECLEEKFFVEKNRIIDYEKYLFNPCFEAEGAIGDVLKIRYNIYLRERADYVEWKIDGDESGWNYTGTDYIGHGGDLVAYAGFDDDDIYYQKKKVGMSFLRLSFYDNTDRRTQSLLGYSTMFLDSAALYKEYIQKKNKYRSTITSIVADDSNEPRLTLNFTCESKYKSEQSSEGFYLYLFPSLLDTQKKEGEESILYMKAEFNNAKYGKTVPFVTAEPNEQEYVVRNGDNLYIDMPKLFEDMYIRIGIRYDENTNRYLWRFMDAEQQSEIVINLFEPRVNKNGNDI